MAIGPGSIVSPKVIGVVSNVHGPVFGSVESGAGPYIVLWEGGVRATDISAVTVDEILSADGTVAATYVARRVKPTSPSGATAYGIGVCVRAYKRSATDYLLLQLGSGAFLEILASQAEVVS
jgi:hypothetical protein